MKARNKWRLLLMVLAMIAILVAIAGPLLLRPALAESEPTSFRDVVLSIYPEYDDPYKLGYPTLLVMLEGQIEGASAPTNVRFLVPRDAIMYSAGSGPRDKYVGGPPNRKPSDIAGWDEISYELKTNFFVVEYYVPISTSPDRSFAADFIPLYTINGLTAIVQEPRRSKSFSVVPQTQPGTQQQLTDGEGFTIHNYSYNALQSRQSLSFALSYIKNDAIPSLGSPPSNKRLILVAVIAGAVLFGIALYWVTRKSSSRRYSQPARRSKAKAVDPPRESEPASARFCTSCGAELEDSQRFCHECGAKQREPSAQEAARAAEPPRLQSRARPKSKRRKR